MAEGKLENHKKDRGGFFFKEDTDVLYMSIYMSIILYYRQNIMLKLSLWVEQKNGPRAKALLKWK